MSGGGGGLPRSCSWSVTPASPPVSAASLCSTQKQPQQKGGGDGPAKGGRKTRSEYLQKRSSLCSLLPSGSSSSVPPNRPVDALSEGSVRTVSPSRPRSPRRSLGAVWRTSPSSGGSSPARQLSSWLGRRPRSFAGVEDEKGVTSLIPSLHSTNTFIVNNNNNGTTYNNNNGSSNGSHQHHFHHHHLHYNNNNTVNNNNSYNSLAPPSSPVPSHCSSSPELPSPMDAASGLLQPHHHHHLHHPPPPPPTLVLSTSSSRNSLGGGAPSGAFPRPAHLVISGHVSARRRRLSHSPWVPRLCNVTVTRLQVTQPLGGDLTSVTLAVKMQSSKRTLRSNEIPLPSSGLLDTELQLTFSLQYPHFLKREGNTLHIMVQRRKKYKNRTILGYKTLAVGAVNMSQVLQRPVDRDLELHSETGKDKSSSVARVTMVALSSQPVDTDEANERHKAFMADNPDRSVDLVEVYSDEDEDYSSQDEGSDSEPILEDGSRRSHHHHHHHHHHLRSNTRSKSLPPNARQRNLKQRFIALLKRFKVPEALQAFDHDQELDPRAGGEVDEAEFEDLFDELENLSDSGPEVDTISITSTPKPSLRPYFSSSRSLLNEGLNVPADKVGAERLSDESSKRADSDHMENWSDQEHSDPQCLASSPPREDKNKSNKSSKLFTSNRSNLSLKERRSVSSVGGSTPRQEKAAIERSNSNATNDASPRKVLLEQLARVLPAEDVLLPEHVMLVNTGDSHGPLLAAHLTDHGHRVITTMSPPDVKATMQHLVNKLQKFCNSNAKAPGPMKVVVVGSDTYINCVLRPYVAQFSSKPPDFQNHVRFLIIPLGVNSLSKYLGSIDSVYGAAFVSESWREVVERWEKPDVQEVVNRVHRYLTQAQHTLHLPIAEAMLTYKEKSGDDESSQAFVPFITDVRLGTGDVTSTSVDLEDTSVSTPTTIILPGSPPAQTGVVGGGGGGGGSNVSGGGLTTMDKPKDNTTPPSSPNINSSYLANYRSLSESGQEPLDLQLDYWLTRSSGREEKEREKDKDKARVEGGKYSMKTSFRSLHVARLAPLGVVPPQDPLLCQHLTLSYATKEKKQRIMRLGKKKEKERESESKREVVDGVIRLLASAKNQPFKVSIDSVEWINVKFFQLSSQWQTQIKTFPISLFTLQDSNL